MPEVKVDWASVSVVVEVKKSDLKGIYLMKLKYSQHLYNYVKYITKYGNDMNIFEINRK